MLEALYSFLLPVVGLGLGLFVASIVVAMIYDMVGDGLTLARGMVANLYVWLARVVSRLPGGRRRAPGRMRERER